MALINFLFNSIGLYDLISLFSISLIGYTIYFYYSYFTRENPLPGPLPLPFVGNIIDRGFDDFVEYTERMRKKHGDMFELYFGPKKFIMLSKYEYMNNMFDYSIDSKYMRRLQYLPGLKELDIAGKGIAFNHDVNVWKYNRHFISRALLTPSFSKYAVIWVHNLVDEMIDFWKDASNDEGCFETDIVEWAFRFTTDAITYLTTGKRVHSMEAYYGELLASQNKKSEMTSKNNTKDATKFFKSIQALSAGIYFFIIVPPQVRKYIPFIRNEHNNHLENRNWVFNNIDDLIKRRRKEIEHTPQDQKLRFDMLTSMITANTDRDICEIKVGDEEHTKPMTDEEIRGILWETYFGGIDTTAILFTFIVYYLEHHPDVLKQLHNELDAFFEKQGNRRLDIESLSELVYTEAIVKEALRIFSPAPYTARNSTAKDVVGGYVWPEGTQYIINLNGINRSEAYWDEPEKFNPNRWLNNNNEKLLSHIAFGGGRRVCPGRKLSFIELKCMIALSYHKFDIELVDKTVPKTKFILIRSFCELNVRIKPRKV